MGVHLEGPGEVIIYFINPKTILIFGAIEIVLCLIGMIYVILKKDHEDDIKESKVGDKKFKDFKDLMLSMRQDELEKMNGTIGTNFTQSLDDSGECCVGEDPLDEIDWTRLNLKIENEYEEEDSYDMMDFSKTSLASSKRGKRWGIKRLLKANKSSQMGTIKEEQNPTDNSSFMGLESIQSTSDQQSSSLQSSPGSTGLKESTGSTFDQQSSSLQSSPGSTGSSGWTGSTLEADYLIDLKVLPKKSVEMAGKESLNGSCVNPQLQVKQVNKEHLDNGQINAGFLDDE